MTLPRLDSATVHAYLTRLGSPAVTLDLEGLSGLVRAHLQALPFHNLTWLRGRHPPPCSLVEATVEGNILGRGGTCHELTPSFVALLRALGFEAWLAAATPREAEVLSLGIVRLAQGRFAVDIGSGHPCLQPLPLDDGPSEFSFHGQSFRFERVHQEQYRLSRGLADGQGVEVYRFSPAPCSVASLLSRALEQAVRPRARLSLDAVHAVRMSGWALAILREGLYQRFAAGLSARRPVTDWEALTELLRTLFGVPEELLQQYLPSVGARDVSRAASRFRAPLRFILSLAGTGRAESVEELLGSAGEWVEQSHRPRESVGVLVLENDLPGGSEGALEAVLQRATRRGLRMALRHVRDTLGRLAPFQHLGLLPESLPAPLPIGASRMLQAALLWEHLRTGALGLPHPGDGGGPVVVWMLDDDLSFRRLREGPRGLEVEPGDDLFERAEKLWASHPHVSVVLGTFTGDPPIPGYATFRVQVHDLVANLRAMEGCRPEQAWSPGEAPRALRDYYYDHARGTTEHLDAVFPWKPPGAPPWSVREAFGTLCTAFTRVPHGHQVTRPLTHVASGHMAPGRNRGGNALFLDPDALVAAPYPVLLAQDGIATRRADTLWAHLVAREPLLHMVHADFDLLHGRRMGDGSSPLAERQPDAHALHRFVQSQERGVVLARLLEGNGPMETADVQREISIRRALLARSRMGLLQEAAAARRLLANRAAWWWREEGDAAHARACLVAVEQVELLASAVDALDEPWLPARLAEFARHVVAALPGWRAMWR